MTTTDEQNGLLQLLAIRDGTAPPAPIQELLDFDLVEVTEGTATFRYRPHARHLNPLGTVHGGVAMTLLDSAA
ncbi:MAG TPA: PaaI family thioesterase, partial [Solirubrobacteraceae bacterium]|nr:PaaI family thioesterase [Solirubrobacteraceae bacterium]